MGLKMETLAAVNVASAGTAVVAGSGVGCYEVHITGLAGNTGSIYVGDSTVDSTNGIQIGAGVTHVISALGSKHLIDLSTIYIDAATNGNDALINVLRVQA